MNKEKTTIDEKRLTALIDTLLKTCPPSTEKNIKMAFQQVVSGGFSEIIIYSQWHDIYKKNRSSTRIVRDILSADKIKVSGFSLDTRMGRGGHRGISRRWNIYRNAELILFETKKVLQKFNLKFEVSSDFLFLIGKYCKRELPNTYDVMTQKALRWCGEVLNGIIEEFDKTYNPQEKKHRAVVALLFGKNHPLTIINNGGGKKVTNKSIYMAINEIRKHIAREKRNTNIRIYGDKEFYYLAWLTSICDIYMGFLSDPQMERAIREIQNILSPFKESIRRKIVEKAVKRQGFSDEALSRLFSSRE